MKKVLIVIGSARKGRAADAIAKLVSQEVKALGAEPILADLKIINLPFFDNELAPSSEGYELPAGAPQTWGKLVAEADGVVLLTPEYNHATSAILKNSVDWLHKEWIDKPVSLIGYGWGGAPFAIANLTEVLNHVKTNLQPTTASLFFTKSIGTDGTPMESAAADIRPTLEELVKNLK